MYIPLPVGSFSEVCLNMNYTFQNLTLPALSEADLLFCDVMDNREKFSSLRILSFDIECDVGRTEMQFPSPKFDSVIQIGAMVSHYGEFS